MNPLYSLAFLAMFIFCLFILEAYGFGEELEEFWKYFIGFLFGVAFGWWSI